MIDKASKMMTKNETLFKAGQAVKLLFYEKDIEKHSSLLDRLMNKIQGLRTELTL
jgi:hypothetical protein